PRDFPSSPNPAIISAMRQQRDLVARRMDWLSFNLRWLLLTAAVVVLVFWDSNPARPNPVVIGLLGLTALYNIVLTLFRFFEFHPQALTWASLLVDSLLALSLFVASGGMAGRLAWIGLWPGLMAALHFRAFVALAVIVAFTLAQAGLTLVLNRGNVDTILPLGIIAAILWPLTLGAAQAGKRLRSLLQTGVQGEQSAEAQRARILRGHARAIYDMSSMLSATLDYEQVLEAALDFGGQGAEGLQPTSSNMVSAVLFFRDDQLRVTSARRFTAADYRQVCPGQEGVLQAVIRTGEPMVIQDPSRDAELKQFVSFQPCRSLMALPLRAGFETYGMVLYGHPRPDFFDTDQRALLDAVVNQAIIALQNAQLFRNLRQEKERLVEVQEEAQKKLARDLHDGPTQAVAALAMRANFVRRLIERDPKSAADELFKMEDLARKTTKEIRHMLFTLRPLVLESQGLTAALRQLAEKMRETHDQNVIVEAEPGIDDRLEMNHQGVLFYIVEEAVNNARKHAQAEHIWMRLKSQRDVLIVEIEDDGVGFNVGSVDANYDKRGSLGMVNMRERTEMLNGAVKIQSAEGQGTRITILVPLTEHARERVRV
ncbi:MAG: GAF domain-containing sensor histidine kinase, partial [Anaerolineales bacterium]